MNIEITTVETSQGEALEKQSITNVNIDLTSDTVVVFHNKTVVRRDGVEVPMQSSVPIHIGGTHTHTVNHNLTKESFAKEEVDVILNAKETFLKVLEEVLKSKKTVLKN